MRTECAQRDRRIWFNPELVRAPSMCIDYVVAHEACHLRYPNHGPEFYRQLDQVFPNWQEHHNELRAVFGLQK
jgi:predicted metal-dependent hydrolase